ncbi:hypothetical protein BCR43DRAFT_497815 [Syncephalastrum racemosum]|uniref:Uncharacterized protein n=1 Tax=Syncephalastrum racemosum TaxID=13706 RepID=A0A1X2H315_SYNRA|nr:hypothetical protein BCR43DRAFT_497815 [Syncephalastrum racemosum]
MSHVQIFCLSSILLLCSICYAAPTFQIKLYAQIKTLIQTEQRRALEMKRRERELKNQRNNTS